MQKPTLFELLRQSLQDVEGGYDMLAPKFDASSYVTPEALLIPFFHKIQSTHGSFEDGIDICCGTGAASRHLMKLCRKKMTLLDISRGMLDQCKSKLEPIVPPSLNLSFIKCDALDMPFENQFDVAVSFGAFGHIPKKHEEKFLKEIHKVLKPGGKFFFITTEPLPFWLPGLWMQRGFNLLIGLRNLLIKPKFIMYYLTFQLPGVQHRLASAGFDVKVFDDVIFKPDRSPLNRLISFRYFRMVQAEKRLVHSTVD